jgi:hypothetical protein
MAQSPAYQALTNQYTSALANSMQNTAQNIAGSLLKEAFEFDPNTREAFQMPLSQLVVLWQAKYGDKWVTHQQMRELNEPFYLDAFYRLECAKLFEEYNHQNSTYWNRLKEGV